jgi:hypothetical protein
MNLDAESVAVGGVGLWLLQWMAKHILDRLFLPRLQDSFARLNKKLALMRAEQVLRQYHYDVSRQQGVLWKLRDEVAELYMIIVFTGALVIAWPIITTLQDPAYNDAPLFSRRTLAYMYAVVCLALIVFARIKMNIARRDVKARDAEAHRAETQARLKNLLTSAGLDNGERERWLSRLSPSQGKQ